MINFQRYQYLASKWISGEITEAEKEEFLAWYSDMSDHELVVFDTIAKNEEELKLQIFDSINSKLDFDKKERNKKFKIYKYVSIAASLLVIISIGIYSINYFKKPVSQPNLGLEEIKPGSTKATLELESGHKIQLSSTQSGVSIGDSIVYLDGSSIYNNVENKSALASNYAIMSTPRGGEYKLELADGTHVWLNSETSIRFPSTFNTGTRSVELLAGEVYFEVSKKIVDGKTVPFEVLIKKQKIEVLGTAFNVKSYGSAQETITTVSEGTVAVKSIDSNQEILEKVILHEGGQSILYKGQITKKIVDPEEFIAWKDGYFYFVDADIYQVMNEFKRWYDIEVNFEIEKSDDLFNGRIPKNVNLSKALNILKLAGVSFELIDNKVLTINRKPN